MAMAHPVAISAPHPTISQQERDVTVHYNDRYHDRYNDNRYRCCCNAMHVERGAYVIAFIGALLAAIFGVLNLLTGNIVLFVIAILFFLIYWFILAAQRKRNPGLYIPFLVINGIGAVLLALYIIFLVIMLIALPDFWARQHYDGGYNGIYGPNAAIVQASGESGQGFETSTLRAGRTSMADEHGHPRYVWGAVRLFTWLQLIYAVVAEALTIYFWFVVYRAWQYIRADRRDGRAPVGAGPAVGAFKA